MLDRFRSLFRRGTTLPADAFSLPQAERLWHRTRTAAWNPTASTDWQQRSWDTLVLLGQQHFPNRLMQEVGQLLDRKGWTPLTHRVLSRVAFGPHPLPGDLVRSLLPYTHPETTPDPDGRHLLWKIIGHHLEQHPFPSQMGYYEVIPWVRNSLEKETSATVLDTLGFFVARYCSYHGQRELDRVAAARLQTPARCPDGVESRLWDIRLLLNRGHENPELQNAIGERLRHAPEAVAAQLVYLSQTRGLMVAGSLHIKDYLLTHLFQRRVPLPGVEYPRGIQDTDGPSLIMRATHGLPAGYAEHFLLERLVRGQVTPDDHIHDWLRWIRQTAPDRDLAGRQMPHDAWVAMHERAARHLPVSDTRTGARPEADLPAASPPSITPPRLSPGAADTPEHRPVPFRPRPSHPGWH
jgi:hypothetical protein